MLTPLCELANKYVTDKWTVHRYTPTYWEMFEPMRQAEVTLVEIGIGRQKGPPHQPTMKHAASLYMWEEFFTNGDIIGIDNNVDLLFKRGRIRCYFGDQGKPSSMVDAVRKVGKPIDILIDDGSHRPNHQVSSCIALKPFVKAGGVYIIEDIHEQVVFDQLPFPCQIFQSHHPSARMAVIQC
jgi:8-demethyl-8-alpha-L-rhamnosyltetracenomycin-C 2'-O-methyltransferase